MISDRLRRYTASLSGPLNLPTKCISGVWGSVFLNQNIQSLHYCSRRVGHLLKVSMVSAVDRGNLLRLEAQDFDQGLSWLHEAEALMPQIFQQGQQLGPDAQAMDEIVAYINGHDMMEEHKIVRYARRLVPAHAVLKVIEIMEKGNIIQCAKVDSKTGTRLFKVVKEEPSQPSTTK